MTKRTEFSNNSITFHPGWRGAGRGWVALSGPPGSGKDTLASYLVGAHGFTRVAFADPVREMALAINPYVHDATTTQRLRSLVDVHGWEGSKREFPEVRRLLQVIGTDAVRAQSPDFWVDQALATVRAVRGPVVFTDTRFLNEAERVVMLGGISVNIEGPSDPHPEHESEGGLADFKHTATVHNPRAPRLVHQQTMARAARSLATYLLKELA